MADEAGKHWCFHFSLQPCCYRAHWKGYHMAPAVGTGGGHCAVLQPGQETQAWVALSENALKAYLFLTGQDLSVLSC